MNFSPDGAKLASVSTSPDFMLTIWDWEEQQMGLHSKAFGQDVYNVFFSQDDPGRLTTSGVGHIRFWKMAATFTGLKLQGSIGKFGKIDLSDIDTFVELPDGKVISSTESGALLVWEGHFIKCRLTRSGGRPCHDGAVTYLGLDRVEKRVVSAAVDGYIRWWSFAKIDNAEVDSDHSMDFELEPIAELYLGEGVGVKSMIDSGSDASRRLLVILDTTGRMLSYSFAVHEKAQASTPVLNFCGTVQGLTEASVAKLSSAEPEEFVVDEQERFYIDKHIFENFHAAGLTGMDTCPYDHLVATCSTDGTVRCFDYVRRQMVAVRKFGAPATCLKWLPKHLDPTGRMIAVGFGDGVVRVLALGEDDRREYSASKSVQLTFLRKLVFKPHNAPVIDLAFSSDSGLLATSGADGIVFFFQCQPVVAANVAWNPVRFVTMLPESMGGNNRVPVSCRQLSWSPDSRCLLCTCTDGVLREVDLSTMRELIMEAALGEEVVTFEANFPVRDVITRVPLPAVPGMGKSSSTATLVAPTPGKPETEGTAPSSPVKGESAHLNNSASQSALSANETRPGTADTSASVAGPAFSAVPAKINAAIYSLKRNIAGALTSASLNQKNYTFEQDQNEDCPMRELPNGLFTADGKDQLKNPLTRSFRYSHTKNFLVSGLSDGSVVIRPAEFLEVFARAPAHSGVGLGAALVATSFDDRYLLSGGTDGTLVVRRVRLDLIEARARPLYQDIDAGVFAGSLIKAAPLTAPVEPNYLTHASTLIESSEKALFALGGTPMEPVSVLAAVQAEAEERDIAAGTYSIQDNRLKLEEDARKVAADELKLRVKASILALRKDYENILRENESIPEVARLSADELMVDREYLEILAQQGAQMIEEVHRDCEYEAEKAEALLQKLTTRMMDGLLMDEITLAAFNPPRGKRAAKSTVRSFRARSLDPSITTILGEVHKMVRVTELKEAQIRINETAQRKANEAMTQLMQHLHNKDGEDGDAAEAAAALAQLEMKGTHSHTHTRSATELTAELLAAESSVAARRQKRIERKDGLKKHLVEKPNEDEDDIRDLNAIRIAEKTIGDYKLKCADDYEVPEEQRSNAAKKLRQMALLEESMLSMRLQFNERFLALRNLKREIVFAVRRDNKRVREIDAELEQSDKSQALWEPKFDPDEFPDDADEVTEAELAQFESDRRTLPWEKVKPPKHIVVTGSKTEVVKNNKTGTYEAILRTRASQNADSNPLQNILTDAKVAEETPARTEPPRYYEVNPSILKAYVRDPQSAQAKRLSELERKIPALRRIHDAMHVRMHLPDKSEVQHKAVAAARSRLEFERAMILAKLDENIAMFGEAVDDLRTDRHAITADLKLAELKLLVLFQEYQLLLTFEGRDAALQQKQLKCKSEETEIKSLTAENRSKLESKEDELQNWVEKLSLISSEFKTMLPDSHPYCETLTKIFKKKIKRSKGRDDGADEEDYESDDGVRNCTCCCFLFCLVSLEIEGWGARFQVYMN
jgi:WD40 repeat protein